MGIQGLLPFLRNSSRPIMLSEFRGCTAAIDVYCWLHKGAFSCAEKLVKGEPTDGYVVYVMKQINLLLSFDIKPILVFDGCHLPAKEVTESKRRENRKVNRQKAKSFLREGKVKEARECFQRCVEVTSDMAFEVIKACRARNVDIIVAPYEADAQLAYLNHSGIADIVITEDSDLVLFGCSKMIFKMDSNGGGCLVEKEKLHLSLKVPRDKFDFTKFRHMCVLSGCDYLPSLRGVGLVKACRFFTVTSNPDIFNSLCRIPAHLKMPHLEVSLEYRKGFMQAVDTILHQLVFDPITRTMRPLTPYTNGVTHEDMPYCGSFLGHERAFQIAIGNVNVQTGQVVDHYEPGKTKVPEMKSSGWNVKGDVVTSHASIWDSSYMDKKKLRDDLRGEEAIKKEKKEIEATKGKTRFVVIPTFKRKLEEPGTGVEMASEDMLKSIYFNKRSKISEESNCGDSEVTTKSELKNTSGHESLMALDPKSEDCHFSPERSEQLHENHKEHLSVNGIDHSSDKEGDHLSDHKSDKESVVPSDKESDHSFDKQSNHVSINESANSTVDGSVYSSTKSHNPFAALRFVPLPEKNDPDTLEESSQPLAEELNAKDNREQYSETELQPKSPKIASRNPFAKKIFVDSENKNGGRNEGFSALRTFSSTPKARTVVLSKYFRAKEDNSSSLQKTENPSLNENDRLKSPLKPHNELVPSPDPAELRIQHLAHKLPTSTPSQVPKKRGCYDWSSNSLLKSFSAEKKSIEPKVNKGDDLPPGAEFILDDTPPVSQSYNEGVASEDLKESLSLNRSSGNNKNSSMAKDILTPPDEKKTSRAGGCRVSGLTKKRATSSGKKQLNLKEMFAFKRDKTQISFQSS